jgi:integrase
MKLTDISVRALRSPKRGQKLHADDSLAGFGVRVSQGGAKTFVLVYGDDRRRLTIGRYPVISLSDARTEAKRILAERTLGRRKGPSSPYNHVKQAFLGACRVKNRPSTVKGYTRHLNKHFQFGSRKLDDIDRHDIRHKLDRIAAQGERDHAIVALKAFFTWAVKNGYLESSPCAAHFAPVRSLSRERVLDPDELRKVVNAANLSFWRFGAIVQLCLLTGQRRGEVAKFQWDWIDVANQTITIPAAVAKNGRTHTFPYGDSIAVLLARLPLVHDELLFPARTSHFRGQPSTCFNGWGNGKRDFDYLLDGVAHWTLHDLRRTFATIHAEIGTPIHVTEKLLNHVSGTISGVAAIYNRHTYLAEMRAAVANYEAHIKKLIGGNDG